MLIDMNIEKLRTFTAAAKDQSISRAAEKLHITQSAASQQISSLEKETGLKLIERTSKGIALTEDGEELFPYAQRILDDYDQMHQKVIQMQEHQHELRIFYTGYMEQSIITRAIAHLSPTDATFLSLHYGSYQEAHDSLSAGQCDLAITIPYEFEEEGFHQEILSSFEMRIIARKGTFKADPVDLKDLQKYSFLMLSRNNGGKTTDGVYRFAKEELHIPEDQIIGCDSIESQILLIESGKGISMMPASNPLMERFQSVSIRGKKYMQNIVGIYSHESPAVQQFLSLCKAVR